VVSSGSSACTSALVIRFAFWGAVHAALRKSFGGSGSSYGNEPIANSAEGGGGDDFECYPFAQPYLALEEGLLDHC